MNTPIKLTKDTMTNWAAIVLVLGSGGGMSYMGLKTGEVPDRFTGAEARVHFAEQKTTDESQDHEIYNVLMIAEATAEEVEKREVAVLAVPLIQKDIESIKESLEEQQQTDVELTEAVEDIQGTVNQINTGQLLIIQKLENMQ
jgi:hypothetical protein